MCGVGRGATVYNLLTIVLGTSEQSLSSGADQNSLEGVEDLVKWRW